MTRKSRVSDTELHELSVYDGSELIGTITERDGVRTAKTWPDERSLGPFPTRKAAADALGVTRLLRETTRRAA